MRFVTATLGEIAPANSISLDRDPEDLVWQVTLDHIEADTGTLLKKERKPFAKAGASTHGFDNRHVLYSKLRPYLNKVLVPDEEGIGTTELVPMLPDPERLDRRYLAHYLMTKRFVAWITEHSSGAKMPRATMADFWAHEIPLPPLPEQRRIAAILDKADAIRRKRQQAIELTDQFLRSVFLDLFGDPVTNPKGWAVKPLKELTTKIGSGATPRGGKSAYIDEGISLIRSMNIHDDKFVHKDLAYITDEQASALDNVVVEDGDVMLNITGASVCRTAIVDGSVLPARVNQHVCIIRPDSDILMAQYLLHVLLAPRFKHQLLTMAGGAGATREALTKQQVEELFIPVPSLGKQARFDRMKTTVKSAIRKNEALAGLPLFESLSQKAFSGNL